LEQLQQESDNDAINLFENDKEEEPSQGSGHEGWENVFNKLDQMEEEYQDSSLNNNPFQTEIQKFEKELENLADDGGALHCKEYLYPDNNDSSYLQENIKVIRAVKCSISSLFPEEIEPFDEF
jgi:spore germination protein GerM